MQHRRRHHKAFTTTTCDEEAWARSLALVAFPFPPSLVCLRGVRVRLGVMILSSFDFSPLSGTSFISVVILDKYSKRQTSERKFQPQTRSKQAAS